MKPMTARYGLMLREDGRIFDDGVVFRDAEHQFTITTTTGNAAAALSWLEFLKAAHFPALDVRFLDVGEQWADICLCGPLARGLLATLCPALDLTRETFPFMAVRTGTVAGVSATIRRVSFTGELSYEIWTPRRATRRRSGMRPSRPADRSASRPSARKPTMCLRVEKGFLSMGHEVDGCANPFDLGLDRFVTMAKSDFIGKRALIRDLAGTQPRPELVGLLTLDDGPPLPEGAPIVSDAALSPAS